MTHFPNLSRAFDSNRCEVRECIDTGCPAYKESYRIRILQTLAEVAPQHSSALEPEARKQIASLAKDNQQKASLLLYSYFQKIADAMTGTQLRWALRTVSNDQDDPLDRHKNSDAVLDASTIDLKRNLGVAGVENIGRSE